MNEDLFDSSMLITNNRLPNVLNIIEELEIYQHYAPLLVMGTQKSPLRPEVNSPSFSLHERDGRLYFKDHGEGEYGDVLDFVQAWYKAHMNREISMKEINKVIYYDMNLGNREHKTVNGGLFINDIGDLNETRGSRNTERWKIQVVDEGWTDWAMNYWIERYNIAPSILKAYYVGHAKQVWVTPPGKKVYLWGVSTPDNPIFYFYFPKSGHVKCYRPMEKNRKKKWIMNCDNTTDIQGYYQMQIKKTLPRLIILTKAMKEVIFYRSFHLDAIAIHGENHIFTPDFIRHIRKYSTNQLGVYDNDKPGKHSAWLLRKKYQVPQFFIAEAKNITDLWEKKPHLVLNYIDQLKEAYQL